MGGERREARTAARPAQRRARQRERPRQDRPRCSFSLFLVIEGLRFSRTNFAFLCPSGRPGASVRGPSAKGFHLKKIRCLGFFWFSFFFFFFLVFFLFVWFFFFLVFLSSPLPPSKILSKEYGKYLDRFVSRDLTVKPERCEKLPGKAALRSLSPAAWDHRLHHSRRICF